MEVRNSTILESSGEDSMLIETVKNIVTQEERNESENEANFFMVSQEEQYTAEPNIEEAASQKSQTENTLVWTDLCRICANMNDYIIPIFEDEGLKHDLSNKILKYLPIHVSKDDTLPLQLCYHCAAMLLAWHELSEGCQNAEKRLLELQSILQNNKHQYYNTSSLENLETATVTTVATTTIVSDIPISQSNQEVDEKNIKDIENVNKSNRLKNQIIDDQINALSCYSRKIHKLLAQEDRNDSIETKTAGQADKILKNIFSPTNNKVVNDKLCRFDDNTSKISSLDRSAGDEEEYQNIKNADTRSAVKTRVNCTKKTKETQDIGKEHTVETYESNQTNKNTENVTSVGGSILICKHCGKKFRSYKSYRAHTRTHTGEKSYTCHVCGKQFVQGGSLYYHLKHVHDGVKNHACDICGRSFAMKTALEDHRRIHTGERPYVCHACGKTFKTKASLYIHGKTHTDDYPHRCVYCPKRFRWRQQMLGHLTVHTGEKNHTCDVCGKGFGVKNDLTRHKRVHSEEKPFACQQCGLSFGQKRYLRSHERLTHL